MREALVIFGRGLALPELNHIVGFAFAHIGAVDAHQSRRAGGEKQHVAFSQQVFGCP